MFTGLVQAMGTITARAARGGDLRLAIDARGLGDVALSEGESIAVNGVCLTAIEVAGTSFMADVSNETLGTTTTGDLNPGDRVNLERSLALGQPLGGHLVSGHVDAVGEIRERTESGRSWRFDIRVPADLHRFLAVKGSVCVDGVSLTINSLDDAGFAVNVVPHTQAVTTIGRLGAGARVNIEVDIIARYLERLLASGKVGAPERADAINAALLEKLGFIVGRE